jgi:hypothetical protein
VCKKLATSFSFPIVFVLLLLSLTTGTLGAKENKALAWRNPTAGTHAFLGDDGGGVNTATVCDTADRFRDWLKMESAPGCQTFQHGLPVVIEVVLFDPVRDTVGSIGRPIVKVHIPARNFTGYTQLLGVHPVVPSGTKIQFTRVGNTGPELYDTADAAQSTGHDLGEKVSATVLSYDPTSDDKFELHVQIDDGSYTGRKGWMLSLGATTDDGGEMDQFDKAVIENRR